MIEFGCLARYFNDYRDEVQFAKDNGFSFMQIWYDKKGLNHKPIEELLPVILDEGFPAIIHALLDINEIPDHITILKDLLIKLGHKQLIIHPICRSEPITDKTIHKLAFNMHKVVEQLKPCGITVFIENNSKLDPIFTSSEELKIMFSSVPELEFLMDVAHMDSIEQLKELVSVKIPKILHVADRRLEEIHEHLPIGKGNIDFQAVFNDVLPGFEGMIAFEIIQSSNDIIAAKKYFEDLLCLNIPMKIKFDANILIHKMQTNDYREVYELWDNTPGMGLSDADSQENIHRFLLRNKGLSFVCRHEDRIIGTILCGHDGRRGYIYHVTVSENYRGRGIGQMLVEKSLQKLKDEGIRKCHLFVFSDNVVGNAFWNSKGWIKRGDIYVYSKSF